MKIEKLLHYTPTVCTLATAIHDGQKVFAVQVHAGRYKHGVWLMKISDSTDSCQMAKRNEFSFTVMLLTLF